MDSRKIKKLLSVLLILIMLSLFTRNVENNPLSSTVNGITYGLSKVSAAAVENNKGGMSYDELKAENEQLKEANSQLRARLVDYYSVKSENARLWKFYGLKKEHGDYDIIPAVVLRRDSNDEFYSFTIDKGTSSDVNTGDPVMGESGLIGWIGEADVNTAKVVTILSPRAGIGAVDAASTDRGIVTGSTKYADKNQTMFAKLKSDHQVKAGDIITTTGISGTYPKDLVLGEVKEIAYDTFDTSYYAVIEPYDNIRRIVNVAVITSFSGEGEILRREE